MKDALIGLQLINDELDINGTITTHCLDPKTNIVNITLDNSKTVPLLKRTVELLLQGEKIQGYSLKEK